MADNRRATRLGCRLPLRLEAAKGPVEATLLDVSRSGARIRVPGAALNVYRLAPLSQVARRVSEVLGEAFTAVLAPERLGSLVTKGLRPVRIGQRDATSADVELGCLLSPPLTDLEASLLGLALPRLSADGRESAERIETTEVVVRVAAPRAPPPPAPASTASTASRPAPPPRVQAVLPTAAAAAAQPPASPPGPSPAPPPRGEAGVEQTLRRAGRSGSLGWRAYVHPTGDRRVRPFLANAEAISSDGIQVRVADRAKLQLEGGADVASTIQALDAVFGTDVALKLADGPTHLWTGPARIDEVEVPPDAPGELSLWLRFGRPLRAAELRALGLE